LEKAERDMSLREAHNHGVLPTRRSVLIGALAGFTSIATKCVPALAAADLAEVRALTFDMQGTVFDFYDPLNHAAQAIGHKYALPGSWATALPAMWSNRAHDIIVQVSRGSRPWIPNTAVYREALMPVLVELGVSASLTDEDRDELLAVWGQMIPWPDAVPGITLLRDRYTISTLTNASMAQMTALVKTSKLPFDEILTGELCQAFKPSPKVYQLAIDYIGLRPDQLLMVSAHKWDLRASKQAGFRTAYVPRPQELGPGHPEDREPENFIDIIAKDLVDLAGKLEV